MEIGGINANDIVNSLIQIERQPLTALESRRSGAQDAARAITAMRSTVDSFRFAALRLSDNDSFDRFSATVSNSAAVTASVTSGATPGSLTFSVEQLAASHGLRSSGTVAASNLPVTTDAVLALATGTKSLGISAVRAGTGLGVGSFDLSVVQASESAAATGTSPLAATTNISAINNTLDVSVNGISYTLTLTDGPYDAVSLAAEVDAQLQNVGAAADAALDSSGSIVISTDRQGSDAWIQMTGGTALASLGLTIDVTPRTGTDGIIDVDGNTTVVTSLEAGDSVAVDTGAGTLDVTLDGGLRVGERTITTVSAGSGSLVDVAAAINGAGAGISAAAVRVDATNWRLQLGSTTTGTDGELAVDGAAFGAVGGLVETSAARNARISIGEGPGAYSVEASGNTFDDVVDGVSFTAREVTTSPVTVSVARNDDAIASDVSKLVAAANTLLAEIKVQTRYDVANGTSGVLANNSAIRRLTDQVREALGSSVDGVAGMLPSDFGIQSTRDGSFTFDRATFMTALTERPDDAARFFGRGATAPAGVSFADASASTVTGSYDVDITVAATRAASAEIFAGGALADTRVGVRIGDITATYDVTAGQSAAQIISGLNESIAQAGLDLVVEANGAGLRVRADEWGSAGSFELNLDVAGLGTWNAQAGVNVEGTIDGVAALGQGRTLTLGPLVDTPAAGLSITVDGGVSGALGAISYQPGIAARVAEFATGVINEDTGLLQTASDAADRRVKDFNDQIERFEDRLFTREATLRRQWASLQTLLQGLQDQGSWISSQLASLPQVGNS
ncbi:MAG: flagellar filament capping protein FliD [Ilumatobacter sp.]|jgi:flagellar hook-associated protein 2|uniref:flagellar filament capping protein FliD n=1 Tax=Ilumatobacter sp. TaxID=1967498 RepID=UPI00391B8E63